MIGANVVIQGGDSEMTRGTVTDLDGKFTLSINKQDTAILISFTGFDDQVLTIGNQTDFSVTLKEKVLEDVVVEDYGYFATTQRKKVGSKTNVDGRAFEAVPQGSFDNMIQGRAPGVLVQTGSGAPGSAARVLIRGQGTINGSTAPLYVIDGIPKTPADFAQLNPNDIEEMDILKDAASTSMYGSRAANGVILIRTKRGKDGKVQYGYRYQYGWEDRTQDRFDMMNAQEKLEFEQFYNINGRAASTPAEIDSLQGLSTNWPDEIFRRGTSTQHELTASGGNEKARFYWSGSYFKQDGIVQRSDFERFSSRINFDYKATEKSNLQLTLTAGLGRYTMPNDWGANLNNPILAAYMANPYEPVFDQETGDWNVPGSLGLNPLRQLSQNDSERDRLRYTGSIQYTTELTEDLTFKTRLGFESGNTTTLSYFDPESFLGQQYNGGFIRETFFQFFDYNNVNSLQYDKTIADDHDITLVAATEILGGYSENTSFSGTSVGDSRIRVARAAGEPIAIDGTRTRNSLIGGLLVGVYSYKDKYIVQAAFRRDGSSRFGIDTKYANFWSLGATWNITDESWFDNSSLDFISTLKLRASYGTQGNQDFGDAGDFPWRGTFASNAFYIGQTGYGPTRLENAGLTWEQQNIANIGLDFAFLKERITGTLEVYNKETDNLFYDRQVTRTSGFPTFNDNIGSIRNRGIELDITGTILRKRDLEWKVRFNYSINDNQVLEVDQGRPDNRGLVTIREGEPLFSFFMVRYAGVNAANGDPLYYDRQGNITPVYSADHRVVLGQTIPPNFGGIDNIVNITLPNNMGRIDFTAFLVFVTNVDRYNNVRFFTENANFGGFNQTRGMLNAWKQPGDVTEYHRYGDGLVQPTDYLVEDASYARLRNVVIGYTFPDAWVKKLKLTSARIYAQGQNLATWTAFTNFDPENFSAVDVFQYPVPRAYTIGVNVQF